jgi:adenylate kinase family enzyme
MLTLQVAFVSIGDAIRTSPAYDTYKYSAYSFPESHRAVKRAGNDALVKSLSEFAACETHTTLLLYFGRDVRQLHFFFDAVHDAGLPTPTLVYLEVCNPDVLVSRMKPRGRERRSPAEDRVKKWLQYWPVLRANLAASGLCHVINAALDANIVLESLYRVLSPSTEPTPPPSKMLTDTRQRRPGHAKPVMSARQHMALLDQVKILLGTNTGKE